MRYALTLLALLAPANAFATGAKIPLACSSTVARIERLDLGDNENGWKETSVCADETAWLDISTGVDLFALQLTGKRQFVSLGASPALGLLLAWKPAGWSVTPLVLGAELTVAMTLISPEIAEGRATHVEAWTVLGLNVLGWMAIGIGGRYQIAIREGGYDAVDLVLTGGLRLPL